MSSSDGGSAEVVWVEVNRRERRLRWVGKVVSGWLPLTGRVRRDLGERCEGVGRILGSVHAADRVDVVARWQDGAVQRAVVVLGWGIWPESEWAVQVGDGVLQAVMAGAAS